MVEKALQNNIHHNVIPEQDIGHLIQLLARTAMQCDWEQSVICPCIDPTSKQPRSNCQYCHGRGILFRDPIRLDIALQNNAKDAYNGENGSFDRGTVLATPQLTENAVENGISYRDRITVQGSRLSQSYIISIDSDHINRRILLPYKIISIDHIETMTDDNQFVSLDDSQYEFDADKSTIIIKDPNLVNHNITLSLSVALRYYVIDIMKEYRSAQISKPKAKNAMLKLKYGASFDPERIPVGDEDGPFYRMPKKLILKREDFYIPMGSLTTEGDNNGSEDTTGANNNTTTTTSAPQGSFIDTRDYMDGQNPSDMSRFWG